MAIRETIVVDVWQGEWGLPSVDPQCLKFLAYLKFNSVNIEINQKNNPYFTPDGKFPVVHLKGEKVISAFDELVQFMDKKNMNLDYGLTDIERAEAAAYKTLLEEKLFPALQFIWWLDLDNACGFPATWFSRILPYPFNFYYPRKYRIAAEALVTSLHSNMEDVKDVEAQLLGDAEKCLTFISIRLGSSDFFFGSHPTSMDAVLFCHIAPLLKAPLRKTTLQNHLKACTNLDKFVSRISQRYFPLYYKEFEAERKKENKAAKDQEEDPTSRKNQLIALFVAITAMYGYAVASGIL